MNNQDLNGKPIGPKGGVFWFYSYPPGFYKLMMHVKNNYGDPLIFITENGWPVADYRDKLIREARVDTERIEYYNAHLQVLRDTIKDGVRVVG
ncbi:hypothetical protein L1887_20972 [Cichorium endivia]|nr:hypothetical protein L1887_20972 [Cichorium endivia]